MAPLSSAGGLITPIEPGRPGPRATPVVGATQANQALYANAFLVVGWEELGPLHRGTDHAFCP